MKWVGNWNVVPFDIRYKGPLAPARKILESAAGKDDLKIFFDWAEAFNVDQISMTATVKDHSIEKHENKGTMMIYIPKRGKPPTFSEGSEPFVEKVFSKYKPPELGEEFSLDTLSVRDGYWIDVGKVVMKPNDGDLNEISLTLDKVDLGRTHRAPRITLGFEKQTEFFVHARDFIDRLPEKIPHSRIESSWTCGIGSRETVTECELVYEGKKFNPELGKSGKPDLKHWTERRNWKRRNRLVPYKNSIRAGLRNYLGTDELTAEQTNTAYQFVAAAEIAGLNLRDAGCIGLMGVEIELNKTSKPKAAGKVARQLRKQGSIILGGGGIITPFYPLRLVKKYREAEKFVTPDLLALDVYSPLDQPLPRA